MGNAHSTGDNIAEPNAIADMTANFYLNGLALQETAELWVLGILGSSTRLLTSSDCSTANVAV
jgi:hypothetical protein